MAKIHCLKTWPVVFGDMVSGRKTFEYRRNDRGFSLGDCLILQEWDPVLGEYTGEMHSVRVGYMVFGGQFGIPEGYVIMGVTPVHDGEQIAKELEGLK